MPFVPDTAPTPATGRFVPDDGSPIRPAPNSGGGLLGGEEEAVRQKRELASRTAERKRRDDFVSQNAGGVPISLDEGLPASTRARLSFQEDIDRQADILTKQGMQVRKSKDGQNLLVRQGDKEVLLHPFGEGLPTGGDIAGATFPILKAGATTAAAALSGGATPLVQAGILAGTAATTQALGEGGSRVLEGQDLKGVAGNALEEGAINAAVPLASAAAGKVTGAIRNRILSNAGELEKKLPDAAKRLGVETTAAETTGSPALAKLGKLKPAEEVNRQGALRGSQDRAISPSGRNPVLAESDIELPVQQIFSDAEQNAAGRVRTGLTDAEKAANAQIQAQLDSGLVPTTLSQTEGGKFIRGKVEDAAKAFKAEAEKNYGELYGLAEKENLVVPTKAITALSKSIDENTHKAVAEIVPEVSRVKGLANVLNETDPVVGDALEPLTLPKAIELRAVIRNKIRRGDAVSDIPTRYLTQLDKALTSDIETGVSASSPELKAAYDKARAAYSDEVGKFKSADVAKLFVDPESGRALGDNEIVPTLFKGQGNLDALRKLRDVLSPQDFKLLTRQGLQSIIDESKAGAGMVDAGKFLSRIADLSKTEMADEVLGPLAKDLRQSATLMSRAQGAKVPLDELEDALASKSGAAKLLDQAITREKAYDQTYNSTIQQQLRNGVLGPRTIGNADDFVSRFLKNGSVADVRQALTQIGAKDPALVEQLRQKTLTNVLDSTGVKPPLGKITTGEVADLDPRRIAEVLKPGPEKEKLQAVIGTEGIQFLEDLATYAESTAKRQANEVGRHVAPETLAKEAGSAAIGFKRNAIGALVDTVAPVGRALGGGRLVRSEAFKRWLETGELPSLAKTTRQALSVVPEQGKALQAIDENKDN